MEEPQRSRNPVTQTFLAGTTPARAIPVSRRRRPPDLLSTPEGAAAAGDHWELVIGSRLLFFWVGCVLAVVPVPGLLWGLARGWQPGWCGLGIVVAAAMVFMTYDRARRRPRAIARDGGDLVLRYLWRPSVRLPIADIASLVAISTVGTHRDAMGSYWQMNFSHTRIRFAGPGRPVTVATADNRASQRLAALVSAARPDIEPMTEGLATFARQQATYELGDAVVNIRLGNNVVAPAMIAWFSVPAVLWTLSIMAFVQG